MNRNYMSIAYPQRRTLIKYEKWPEIDGWYWASENIVQDRIDWVKSGGTPWGYPGRLWLWERTQWELTQRLAHACEDGRIRSLRNVQTYYGNCGPRIYGKCSKCNVKLSPGIKTVMMLEGALDAVRN